MVECNHLVQTIKNDEQGKREAIGIMLREEAYRRIARKAYLSFPKLSTLIDWGDVMNEGVTRFVYAVQKSERPIDNCLSFFKSICRNVCSEYLRKMRLPDFADADLVEPPVDPLQKIESELLRTMLLESVNQLSPQCKKALTLHHIQDLPVEKKEDLARELGIDPGSVATILARCKRNLRERIGEKFKNMFNL
jgi:RNA polymerase sigma factor (sigma-70 family)